MSIIYDDEFGKITVRRSPRSRQVRVRVAPDGSLRASLPTYAPASLIKKLLKNSRVDLRRVIDKSRSGITYSDRMTIGKSHQLILAPASEIKVTRQKQQIIVEMPPSKSLNDPDIIQKIRPVIIAALRLEAKSYLPKRLAFLATKFGFSYQKTRFSHAGSRWGSCSSSGTISLNIALMKLPFELIDYVIIHELAHTRQMNHGPKFWELVASADPNYKSHRQALKNQTPSI